MSVAGGPGGTDPWGGNGSDLDDSPRCEMRFKPLEGLRLGGAPPITLGVTPMVQGIPSTSNVLTPRCWGGFNSLAMLVVQMYESGTFGLAYNR